MFPLPFFAPFFAKEPCKWAELPLPVASLSIHKTIFIFRACRLIHDNPADYLRSHSHAAAYMDPKPSIKSSITTLELLSISTVIPTILCSSGYMFGLGCSTKRRTLATSSSNFKKPMPMMYTSHCQNCMSLSCKMVQKRY